MSAFLRRFHACSLSAILCAMAVLTTVQTWADEPGKASAHWYKGNTHGHTLWSDGDELPELVVDWFKTHGYQFLAISDHDRLMEGEQWVSLDREKRPVLPESIDNAKKRFGADWVVQRTEGDEHQVRLKTYDELAATFNEPGKFLMIPNEEITSRWAGPDQDPRQSHAHRAVHMNAINLAEVLAPKIGASPQETIAINLASVQEQSARLHRPILVQLNHPNFSQYDIAAEEMAQPAALKFFEVCNGHSAGIHNHGDDIHPSTDTLWDVANTIRIAKMKLPPLYAIGADDSHNYHQFDPAHANPGRAWIMVHANELAANAIVDAMHRGDFYASTGVTLRAVAYDTQNRTYTIDVQAEPGVQYTIEFIGTPHGADTNYELIAPKPAAEIQRPGRKYSAEVGKVLAMVHGTSATYKLTGNELYVRAVIRSDKPMSNPIGDDIVRQQAWCQPVGWETK